MQTGENEQALRKILDMTRVISITILTIHFYYYCYAAFRKWQLAMPLGDRILSNICNTGLFRSFNNSKFIALCFLLISLLGTKGRKDEKLRYNTPLAYIITGLLMFFLSYLALLLQMKITSVALVYIGLTSTGFLLILTGGTLLSKIIKSKLNNRDPFNRENETFPQEERLLENEFSFNLPAQYQLKNKVCKSWINIINPFRALLVLGTPGAGKSYFVIRHVITQHILKGFTMFVYDFKFDDLTKIVYNTWLLLKDKYPVPPNFFVIKQNQNTAVEKNEQGDFNKKDDFMEKQDIRDRKFGDVIFPSPPLKITNREPPSLKELGPLANLLGVWHGKGTGWNMIALPFQGAPPAPAGFKFRVLMNQYDEELKFVFVDDKVPNRGLSRVGAPDPDQFTVTIDYQQKIAQVHAEDRPASPGLAGLPGLPIHHEPAIWLYKRNRRTTDDKIVDDQVSEVELDVARLASIPHGNSVLALGTSQVYKGMPEIPPSSRLPAGRFKNVLTPDYDFRGAADADPYLEPYRHYIANPYKGAVTDPTFPGFSPADMNQLFRLANEGVKIRRTTTLTVDPNRQKAGISNIPFSVREAEPVTMKSTFWIQELEEKDASGNHKLRLQYSQVVMLHFFHLRQDEFPGRAVWPHISIATLEKDPAGYKIVAG